MVRGYFPVLLDQYQDIQERQEELTAQKPSVTEAYQKEAERRKTEKNRTVC